MLVKYVVEIMKLQVLKFHKVAIACAAGFMLTLSACQPLYTSPDGSIGSSNSALSSISVTQVDTRTAQQVRNHLIFLLSSGITPLNPAYELKIRVSSNATTSASRLDATGKTAGSVLTTVSYELYDTSKNAVSYRGKRSASASFDQTSQSFANERAKRDAENRSAKAVAEQIRLAIAGDLSTN